MTIFLCLASLFAVSVYLVSRRCVVEIDNFIKNVHYCNISAAIGMIAGQTFDVT